jgi:cation diffusion facilitator family transporter
MRRVLLQALLLNVLLGTSKILVGKLTGSLSMVTDGVHSFVDTSTSALGLVVTSFAFAPPDQGHPYGHRKFETSATLVIGLGLLVFAYRLVESALSHISEPKLPEIGFLNWAVMGFTVVADAGMSYHLSQEGRRLQSDYLRAAGAEMRSDIYVSLGVIASFAGARARLSWADPAVAALIAGFIAVSAVDILVRSFHVLTDRSVIPPGELAKVVLAIDGVEDAREIRTRGRPDAVYVDLVAHVDGDMPLREAHDVADRIEAALMSAHPEIVDVIVHVEPARGPARERG